MKKLTNDQWEKKYIAGPVERFDIKNNAFGRIGWDEEFKGRLENWGFFGEVKEKPGYTLQDQALRSSSRHSTMIARFKSGLNPPQPPGMPGGAMVTPNPSIQAMAPPVPMTPMMNRPPERVKIDVSDLKIITRNIKKVAIYFGADLVGICKLDRRWLYLNEEIPDEFQYAIVMAFEEDYNLIKYYPTYIAEATVSMGYSRMAITNGYLSAFIENLGFKAIDCQNDIALSIPMAIQAGLGDLGRLGLLITREFGPRVRISKVITNLPLVADSPVDFGVIEYCKVCKKCAQLCPSQSISYDERTAKTNNISNSGGVLKWPVNVETCRMYWSQVNNSCTTCVACCPYNKPNSWPHRAALWFTDNLRWADSFYVRMDDLLGYGKPKSADKFWEEWCPENSHK